MRKKSFEYYYIGSFRGQETVVAAMNQKQAEQRCVEHFKVKAKQRSEIQVRLMTLKEIKNYGNIS